MAVINQAPKGTKDLLPSQVHKYQYIESVSAQVAEFYGYKEIRTPTFEHTELFTRSVGDTTDIVQKEMYTFMDKGDRSITLRPEGTAGALRAVIEKGLLNEALPLKLFYQLSCFRYEKPQAGRFREFHQFGVELLGAPLPSADVEIISMVDTLLGKLGITDIHLEINSIGCPSCRPQYNQKLVDFLNSHSDKLCKTCNERLVKNPMRVLDCKVESCKEITKDAPVSLDHLCEECDSHHSTVKSMLDAMDINYKENSGIVRGLDYYTKTVFEFISDKIGSQGTVCGGGRYDGLLEQLGAKPTPGIGFGMGIERLVSVMENCGAEFPEPECCDIYIAPMGVDAQVYAMKMVNNMRRHFIYAETDIVGRSLKAQMKYADKIGAKYTIVLGDNEIATGKANLKNMENGETVEVILGDDLTETILGEH